MKALELAHERLRFIDISPPGEEDACAKHLGRFPEEARFAFRIETYSPGRTSLLVGCLRR